MPDFSVRLVGGTLTAWVDPAAPAGYVAPAGAEAPSRLAHDPAHLPTYWKVPQGGTIELRAIVNGVEAPLDAALGGRLFTAWWVQWSDFPPPIVQAAGHSSVATVAFTPGRHLGFFQLALGRAAGGARFVPMRVEAP